MAFIWDMLVIVPAWNVEKVIFSSTTSFNVSDAFRHNRGTNTLHLSSDLMTQTTVMQVYGTS